MKKADTEKKKDKVTKHVGGTREATSPKNQENSEAPKTSFIQLKLKMIGIKKTLFVAVILAFASLLYVYRGEFVVAMIGKKPVTRYELISQLEKKGASQVLESIIVEKLILQKAKEENITVSDKEIQDEITNIKTALTSQGLTLEEAVKSQGSSLDELEKQIFLQKIVQKLVEPKLIITEDQLADFIKSNATYFPADMPESEKLAQANEQLKQSKLNEQISLLIDQIKKEANITYFKKY